MPVLSNFVTNKLAMCSLLLAVKLKKKIVVECKYDNKDSESESRYLSFQDF